MKSGSPLIIHRASMRVVLYVACATPAIAFTLPPAAPPAPSFGTASPPRLERLAEAPSRGLFDAAMLSAFRWQLQKQTGICSPIAGFDGMVDELRVFQATHSVAEQAECADRIMGALEGPMPLLFKRLASQRAWAPASLAWCTSLLLGFLVGDMTVTQRSATDARGGGVLVQQCTVLERTGCKGICLHMCKVPTERMFAERWGVPVHMAPNFATGECQLSFGVVPPALADDTTLPAGCLAGCPTAALSGAKAPAHASIPPRTKVRVEDGIQLASPAS